MGAYRFSQKSQLNYISSFSDFCDSTCIEFRPGNTEGTDKQWTRCRVGCAPVTWCGGQSCVSWENQLACLCLSWNQNMSPVMLLLWPWATCVFASGPRWQKITEGTNGSLVTSAGSLALGGRNQWTGPAIQRPMPQLTVSGVVCGWNVNQPRLLWSVDAQMVAVCHQGHVFADVLRPGGLHFWGRQCLRF